MEHVITGDVTYDEDREFGCILSNFQSFRQAFFDYLDYEHLGLKKFWSVVWVEQNQLNKYNFNFCVSSKKSAKRFLKCQTSLKWLGEFCNPIN